MFSPGEGYNYSFSADVLGAVIEKVSGMRLSDFMKERIERNNKMREEDRDNYWTHIEYILKQLDKPESLIKYVTDRKGHDLRYAIDPTKIETELGWKPKYNFETGIKETINWYMNNQEWMDDVTSGDYLKYYEEMYSKKY